MRLWHKNLLSVLPRQQLPSQWRECCCIAKNLATNGTPNHILVNKILDYPIEHFCLYGVYVIAEMKKRGYRVSKESQERFFNNLTDEGGTNLSYDELFLGWHNDRYLKQCYYNLQEKADCGGISKEEWDKIEKEFGWCDDES